MIRIPRMLRTALPVALLIAATPVSSETASHKPIVEATSTALFTFSAQEKAIRVAAAFVAEDDAVVPMLVRFVDASGNLLKQERGDLSDGNAVVVELTRDDVVGRGDLLVRVEVHHKFPRGARRARLPIMVSTQTVGLNGSANLMFWAGEICGNPIPPSSSPGPGIHPGSAVMCIPARFADF
jgi:hypothetical protein